jgi:Outer membrane protein beta-barrel domain
MLYVTALETIIRTVMKKIGIILLFTAIITQGFSQKTSAEKKDAERQETVIDTNDITRVIVGNDRVVVEDNDNAVKVRIGDRGVVILESLEEGKPRVQFEKYHKGDRDSFFEYYKEDKEDSRAHRRSQFKGHWASIEAGINNYLTSDNSLTLPESIDYMTLHSSKSLNFNFNFSQISLGFSRHVGIVTGLGVNWNNYRFDDNNNIQKGDGGVIEMLDPGAALKKSKFSTVYLNLPMLLEIQIPADYHTLNLAFGPVGAVKLYSNSVMVYEDGDKVKSDSDFSLNLFRYGATARFGFENFHVYGTYYLTPLFKPGKSPDGVDLFPFEIGLAFTVD